MVFQDNGKQSRENGMDSRHIEGDLAGLGED